MDAMMFEPMLRKATIKAVDGVSKKFAGVEVTAENAVTRLLNRWNALTDEEKENVAAIVVATATTAVAAIAAIKSGKKKTAKSVAKRVLKRATRR